MFSLRDIPIVTKIILISNIAVFVIAEFLLNSEFKWLHLFLWSIESDLFKPYQLITTLFMHGSIIHLAVNMIAFFSFGNMLERYWGSSKFGSFYLASGLGGSLVVLIVGTIQVHFLGYSADCTEPGIVNCLHPVVGASGAISGIFAAFAIMMPDAPLQLMLIPIQFKAINFLYFFLLFSVIGVLGFIPIGLSHEGHLGGMLAGIILVKTNWIK